MVVINVASHIGYRRGNNNGFYPEFSNVCVDFSIYNAGSRSLKKRLIQVATGGQLGADQHGRVVVRALENLSFAMKDWYGQLACSLFRQSFSLVRSLHCILVQPRSARCSLKAEQVLSGDLHSLYRCRCAGSRRYYQPCEIIATDRSYI